MSASPASRNESEAKRMSSAQRGQATETTNGNAAKASGTTGSFAAPDISLRHPSTSLIPGLRASICEGILGSRAQKSRYGPANIRVPAAAKTASSLHRLQNSNHRDPAANAVRKVTLNCIAKPADSPANRVA